MIEWISQNRDWIFSGVGVAAIGAAFQWLWRYRVNVTHQRLVGLIAMVIIISLPSIHVLYPQFWIGSVEIKRYHFVVLPTITIIITAVFCYWLLGTRIHQLGEQIKAVTRSDNFQDSIINVPNLKALPHIFIEKRNLAIHNGDPLSILLIDIDNFKRINDDYSMTAGDHILGQVASFIKDNVRGADDAVIRYKMGDEFFIILYRTTGKNAYSAVGDRLKNRISNCTFTIPKTQHHEATEVNDLTVSIGVTEVITEQEEPLSEVSERVENALREAKKTKNQIIYAEPPELRG